MAKKQLKDIPVADVSILNKLAALAPEEDSKSTASDTRTDKKSSHSSNDRADLGRLNVESYLQAFGITYNIKTEGSKTFYRLDVCLFDPNHSKNEAAIVQSSEGLLTYQCFHNSCRGYTWKDARSLISGKESLAQYCEGYDPNWQPPKKKSKKKNPPPSTDPDRPYKTETTQGRIRINIGMLADYIKKTHFGDRLVYYQGHYCWYSKEWGYWKPIPDAGWKKNR